MKRLIKIFAPDKYKIIVLSLLLLVSVMAGLALPTILSLIVDNGINKMDMSYILKWSLLMLLITLLNVSAMVIARRLLAHVSAAFSTRLKIMTFEKANSLPLKKINEIGVGTLLTRTSEDVWHLENASYSVLYGMITIPLSIIGGITLTMIKDWKIGLVILFSFPAILIVVYLLGKKTIPLYEKSEKFFDFQNATIRERLVGIRVIRAFNREDKEREKAKKATEVMAENIIRANVMMESIFPVAVTLLNLAVVSILFIGATKIQSQTGNFSSGDVISTMEYAAYALFSIIGMSMSISMFPRAKVSYRRISELLDAESVPDAKDLDAPDFKGNIRFENVEFIYGDATNPSISEISFNIEAGEKVAFIGGTGAGKSTISHLLMGYYQKTSGKIFFDEVSVEEISEQRLRKNISCVLQKSTMFAGSIKSNIQMGKLDATDEEIREVIEISQLTAFVEDQKEKIEYKVQPNGSNLSGGQKQRIAIARALIKNSPIFVFDDSFSSLDFLTESKIRLRLLERLQGKTQIYITQRVASAISCDKIYVLDKGKIINSGKHEELLEKSKIYREIYASQTGNSSILD